MKWRRLRHLLSLVLCGVVSAAVSAQLFGGHNRIVRAPSPDIALQVAADALVKTGFHRSYFGKFQGTLRAQGTWPVKYVEYYYTEETLTNGTVRRIENREPSSGELILDITAVSGGEGKVKLTTNLMAPRPRHTNGSIVEMTGGPPKDWERDLNAKIDDALSKGRYDAKMLPLPNSSDAGANQIYGLYHFRVAVERGRLMVTEVVPGSQAEKMGLRVGDEIVKVFGDPPKHDLYLLAFDLASGHIDESRKDPNGNGGIVLTIRSPNEKKSRVVRIPD